MSPENREGLRPATEVTADFGGYADEQVARHNGLNDFLNDNLPIVEDIEQCNAALEAAGRPDLAIGDRAEMMDIDTPEDMAETSNNFNLHFSLYTDIIISDSWKERDVFVIPTKDEVMTLADMPLAQSSEEQEAIDESGHFLVLANASTPYTRKPAFIRMLVLFPEFTVDLIHKLSLARSKDRDLALEPELFVAYQLMSRLVDKKDRWVVKEGQTEPDDWYLCR